MAPLFLCPKWSILGSGVTTGVTNWGYIFRKVGLQKWVNGIPIAEVGKLPLFPLYL